MAQQQNITQSIESILFVYGDPVTFKRLSKLTGADEDTVAASVEALQERYGAIEGGALTVLVKDRAAQIVTRPECAEAIAEMTRREITGPLTPAVMEVLAVVAYRGPLSKPDLEAIRGVNCSFALRHLQIRGLVERVPHPEDARTHLYRVTLQFLRALGVERVEDLPEYEALVNDQRIDAILYGVDRTEDAEDE